MADATPQDAEEVVEEVKETIDHSVQRPRDKMMEEIVANREIEVLEDMGEVIPDIDTRRGTR